MLIRQLPLYAGIALAILFFNADRASAQPILGPGMSLSTVQGLAEQGSVNKAVPVYHRRYRRRHRYRYGYGYGPGIYFHFGSPYYYPRYYNPRPRRYRRSRRRGGCGYWRDRCVANWGYRNSNYRGCMRYHGC